MKNLRPVLLVSLAFWNYPHRKRNTGQKKVAFHLPFFLKSRFDISFLCRGSHSRHSLACFPVTNRPEESFLVCVNAVLSSRREKGELVLLPPVYSLDDFAFPPAARAQRGHHHGGAAPFWKLAPPGERGKSFEGAGWREWPVSLWGPLTCVAPPSIPVTCMAYIEPTWRLAYVGSLPVWLIPKYLEPRRSS